MNARHVASGPAERRRGLVRGRKLQQLFAASAVSVLVLGLTTTVSGTTAAIASTSAGAPTIDLSDPAATVADPIARLAPVNTECGPNQIDLNTATAAALGRALNVPSDPTVNRLIALRPWLKGADLSSVPGIGPEMAAAFVGRTCATQPNLPVPTPRACTATTQVDLQSATTRVLTGVLKMPTTTAQALIAARPLSQNLSQVIAPRVPGLSQPTIDTLLRNKRICVTPAPMLAGGSAWRWATPAGGAVVTRAGFSLIVPPGRVTDPAGAYASVTPLPATDGLLPTMDSHIWGNWNSGTNTVAVQGPWIGSDAVSVPLVLHDSSDRGLTVSTGTGTKVSTTAGRPTVTAVQYSLSENVFGTSPCIAAAADTGSNFMCIRAITDGQLQTEWLASATTLGRGAALTITKKPDCGTIPGPLAVAASLGQLPFGLSCRTNTPAADGTASWDITNDAYGSVLGGLAKVGILYNYEVRGGTTTAGTPRVSGNGEDDFLLRIIEDGLTNRSPILFPEQTLRVSKAVNSGETNVDASANAVATAAWSGMADVATLIPGQSKLWKTYQAVDPIGFEQGVSNCSRLSANGMACLLNLLDAASNAALDNPDLFTPDELSNYRSLKIASKALTVGQWLTNFGFALAVGSLDEGRGVLFRNNSVPVALPGGGTGPGGGGVGPAESFIARDRESRRSVLVKPDGRILDIATGATFNCLAATWLVRDFPAQDALNKQPTGTATCADKGDRVWDFKPVDQGGNVPDNVLLREFFGNATNDVIKSWLINSSGAIQSIPDGGTYECLTYANPVVWNVPLADAEAWIPIGTAPASCG